MTFQSWLANFQGPQVSPSAPGQQPQQQERGGLWGGQMGQMAQMGSVKSLEDGYASYGQQDRAASGLNNMAGMRGMDGLGLSGLFGQGGFDGLQPSRDPSYYMDMGQQFTSARDFLMSQTGAGGMLSESSMNPYTRQLAEGSAFAERQRQSDMGYGLAAAGVNPLMAQRVIGEGDQRATEQLGTQFAGFEADLQQRQFGAGAGLVDLSNALNSEMTGRKEDQSRWADEYRLSDKHGRDMADAANKGAKNDLLGSVLGTAGMFAMFSDRRLKKNIRRIGDHPIGVGVYTFSYKWEDKMQVGLMADEVELVRPEAIMSIGPYKMIRFDKL